MAYSRWIDSFWYTYWASTESKNKDEQLFCVDGLARSFYFSYKDILDNADDCLAKIKESYSVPKKFNMVVDFKTGKTEEFEESSIELTNDVLNELRLYMSNFIEDVDREFNK